MTLIFSVDVFSLELVLPRLKVGVYATTKFIINMMPFIAIFGRSFKVPSKSKIKCTIFKKLGQRILNTSQLYNPNAVYQAQDKCPPKKFDSLLCQY